METDALGGDRLQLLQGVAPHSLGKLIEWKLAMLSAQDFQSSWSTPHSLGKLIEWKLCGFYNWHYFLLGSPLAGETN